MKLFFSYRASLNTGFLVSLHLALELIVVFLYQLPEPSMESTWIPSTSHHSSLVAKILSSLLVKQARMTML